jgi:hypothetical protein
MRFDADLSAHLPHWAGGAVRKSTGADVFAEGHQQLVDLYPMGPRQRSLELLQRTLRRVGVDVSPAVGDSVDVDVHPDARLAARDPQHQIRAFRTDAAQRKQDRLVTGQCALPLIDCPSRDRVNLLGLSLVKGYLADQLVDRGSSECSDLGGRSRTLEQRSGHRQHDLVARANREDARDELLKRRVVSFVRQLEESGSREGRDRAGGG